MTTTIALAGKGGVGKTTIAGMVIKYLAQNQTGSILAIDADPASNLNMVLGLDLEWTVGDIREGMLEQVKSSLINGGAAMGVMPGGASKREYLDYHIRTSLAEGSRFDLIAMGRGEGQGCYCAVNHNLREVIDDMSKHYAYVVIDNEAGLEHLSRRTTRAADALVVVSDATPVGLRSAGRIRDLVKELGIKTKKNLLIINRFGHDIEKEKIKNLDLDYIGNIPLDKEIEKISLNGNSLLDLSDDAVSVNALHQWGDKIWN